MRIALYARVSTRDKDQNPETQLLPLRDYAATRADDTVTEYVDTASATDLKHRTAWQRFLEDARHRKIDVVIVWRVDRAFRSVLHAAQTLEALKGWGGRPEKLPRSVAGYDHADGRNAVLHHDRLRSAGEKPDQ